MKWLYFLSIFTSPLFADGGAQAGRGNNIWSTLSMLAMAIGVFYFLLLRPEQKKKQKLHKQRSSMSKGDRVVAAGIVGTLDHISENSVVLKTPDGSKIEVLKQAISDVCSQQADGECCGGKSPLCQNQSETMKQTK